jgi:hypothetical protein
VTNPALPATDLDGNPRVAGGTVDLGAYERPPNTAPTITALAITRTAGAAASNSPIATVSDAEDAENTLSVTATPLTGSGVTVTGISVDTAGNVTADVAASCTATSSSFTLRVTDSGSLFAEAMLDLTVTPETTPPVINTCPMAQTAEAQAGCQVALTDFRAAVVASDNCTAQGSLTVTQSPAPGTLVGLGTTTVTLTVTDANNNSAQCQTSFTVTDTTAPDTTISSAPTNPSGNNGSASFSFSATDNCAVSFECSLAGSAFVPCASPQSYTNLASGSHTFQVRARDASGNVDQSPASYTWTVDNSPPTTTASLSGTQRTCGPNSPPYGGTCFTNSATVSLSVNDASATRQYQLNGAGWMNYTAPFQVTTEGMNTVNYRSVDSLGNVEATKTLTVKVTYLSTPLRDGFNRAAGALGSNWSGATATSSYAIAQQKVDVGSGGAIYWQATQFGQSQQAYLNLKTIDAAGSEQSLLLKVQGTTANYQQGAIRVRYDAPSGQLFVETWQPGFTNWFAHAPVAVTFNNGDELGAWVTASGEVRLYRNCERLATVTLNASDQSFFNALGGRIGLLFGNSANAWVDDFGGGTVTP